MRVGHFRFRLLLVIFLSALIVALLPRPAAALPATPLTGGTALNVPALFSSNPSDVSPQLPVGRDTNGKPYSVDSLASVGDTVYMGGRFPLVKNKAGVVYHRQNLAAYNAVDGAVSSLSAAINGAVLSISPSPDGHVLYIAGEFTSVNGSPRRGLAALNSSTGALLSGFDAHFTKGKAKWVEYACGRLWVGGNMPGALHALNPSTGANTGYQNLLIKGTLQTGTPTRVERFDISPNCSEMVVLGNFTSVGGVARKQVVRLNLGSVKPTVNSWYSPGWEASCHLSFAAYTRAVTYSPGGDFFTIASTGSTGPFGVTQFCDSLSRWDVKSASSSSSPVWVQKTGGDTLLSVADSGRMVCAGGHPRWADNPYGDDYAGHGAVASPGVICVGSANGRSVYVSEGGKTYRWNVTRSRGIGAAALLLMNASDGRKYLLIGGDTTDGDKLGCSQPGGGIDCSQPVNQPGVAAKANACLPRDNFANCTGLVQERHSGVGQLPTL